MRFYFDFLKIVLNFLSRSVLYFLTLHSLHQLAALCRSLAVEKNLYVLKHFHSFSARQRTHNKTFEQKQQEKA